MDIFDISNATNIKGQYDDEFSSITMSVNSNDLKAGITPATYCSFLDYNNNTELNKFGVHNGGTIQGLLNEKWESLELVKVHDSPDEWFVFTASDNDFITQNGML